MLVASFVMLLALPAAGLDLHALSDAELLARAEAEFSSGIELRGKSAEATAHFEAALRSYAELQRRGHENGDLCRNMGNAALLAGDVSRAILSYRQALRLAPRDHESAANLAFAREQVAYAENSTFARPLTDHRPSWLPHLPMWVFVLISSVAWTIWCLCLTRWWMTRSRRWLNGNIAALLTMSVFGIVLSLEARDRVSRTIHPLVVVAQDGLVLRKGNGNSYSPRVGTPLNRGVEAHYIFSKGDWLQVELSSGEIGWVPCAAVLVDHHFDL